MHAFHLPPPPCKTRRRNNFGYLQLSDGSIGLTYVALDDTLDELDAHVSHIDIAGLSPLDLIHLYQEPAGWQRALGLAAINAISQHVLCLSPEPAFRPPGPALLNEHTMPERVGMVGYFGRLIEPLRARGVPLTVIELDETLIRSEPGFEVTLDAHQLQGCSRVIISGTTLINHSLEGLLAHCRSANDIQLLGPSASCLPDVLFDAGVTEIGGFRVNSPDRFAELWASGGRWRDAGTRFSLKAQDYPGFAWYLKD